MGSWLIPCDPSLCSSIHATHLLPSKLYHHQQPLPLKGAKAGHFNAALAEQLQWSDEDNKRSWVEICSGQKTFSEFEPLAMVYAGHQFGQWAGAAR